MSQILSQEEVDALLRGVTDGEIETKADQPIDDSEITHYDLTSQERIIRGGMPTLDIINQRFSRLFRSSLSAQLRKTVDVTVVSTDTFKFGDFIKSLPVPASLHIFKMEPLRGFALLAAESDLVFSLVNIFFGGGSKSTFKIEGRNFTVIEQRMIKKIIISALKDWEKAWKHVHSIQASFVRSEINPQFAAIVSPTDVVVVILFEIEMENAEGAVTICLPYSTIEPIMTKLRTRFQSDQMEVDQTWLKRLQEKLQNAEVEILVELGKTTIKSNELINLSVGDIIQLDNDVADELLLKVEGIPKYKAYPGVSRGNKAIQISSFIKKGA
jgi:flagellar motor switch protein FliM